MRILVVLPYTPYPVVRGTGRYMMNLIEGLSERHDVTLVTMTFSPSESEELKSIEKNGVKVRPMVAPNKRSLIAKAAYRALNILRSAFRGVPLEAAYASPGPFLRLIAETAREEDPDLILTSYWHLYMLPRFLPRYRHALITHDLDFLVGRRQTGAFAGRIDRWMKRRTEMMAYENYGTILTVTVGDCIKLREEFGEGKKDIQALPVVMDLEKFAPGDRERDRSTILFTGAFSSDFNTDALGFFVEEVFPRILEKKPETILKVVGPGVARDLLERRLPNVEFTGYVEDIRAHLAGCSLLVLPLRFGGGIRIRMIEAAAMAVPVVSTAVGVEGLGLTPGRHYIEADGPDRMAAMILDLLGDRSLAEEIGREARAWAEENISMKTYPARLERVLERITDVS